MVSRTLVVGVLLSLAISIAVDAQAPCKATLLPVAADSYPFGAADHSRVPADLRKDGYVEEEYVFSGTANVYDWPAAGPAVVRTPNVPYATRVLVRRPANRDRFSGNVVLEMLNPSNLIDLNIGWAIHHQQFVRNGDAWVGITAKPVTIASLKTFNPTRYAALSWPNPLPLTDPRNCETIARDSERTTENGLIWDMNRQVAMWLRTQPGTQHVYGWGYSQTGSYLYTYVNAIHPLDVKEFGKPLFDAYLIAMSSGPSPINQCAPAIPAGDPRRTVKDVGVPTVRVMSGSDWLASIPARFPDSDAKPNQMRNYEIAGSGHATPDELIFAAARADIVKAGRAVPPMDCNEGPRSRFPSSVAFNAILQNLDAWVRKGIAPPKAEPTHATDGKADLDRFGNVIGGVRSPYVDVPQSTWFGNSSGESFCRIAGHEVPFDRARLTELYPSPADYAKAVEANVKKLVADRFITEADGQALVAEARKSS